MESPPNRSDSPSREYSRKSHIVMACVAAAFGCIWFLVVVAFLLLNIAFIESSNSFVRTGFLVSGMFIIMASLGYALMEFLQPVRVIVGEGSLRIEWLASKKDIPWKEIVSLEQKETTHVFRWSMKQPRSQAHLVLKNADHRKIAKIPGSLENFAECVSEIERRSSLVQGRPTFDREEHHTQEMQKRKRRRVTNVVSGAFLLAMGLFAGIFLTTDHRAHSRLQNEGIDVPATVMELSTYHTAKRIRYQYRDPNGVEHEKRTGIKRRVWESLEEGATITVRVDPRDGGTSELVEGALKRDDMPLPLILLSSVAMCGLGLGAILMPFFGISDIKIVDGKIRVLRIDDPVEGVASPSSVGAAVVEAVPREMPHQVPPSVALSMVRPEEVAASAPVGKCPKGVLALVVLNVVFGLGGMLFNGIRCAVLYFLTLQGDTVRWGDAEMELGLSPMEILVSYGGHVVGILLAFLLLVSAIGLYRLRRWGVVLASLAAGGQILMRLWGLVDAIIGFRMDGADEETAAVFMLTRVFLCCVIVLGMVYPLVVLAVLNRKATKAVFSGGNTGVREMEGAGASSRSLGNERS